MTSTLAATRFPGESKEYRAVRDRLSRAETELRGKLTELLYGPRPRGMNPRHVDLIWPVWNLLDLTPGGRGTDWYPSLEEK